MGNTLSENVRLQNVCNSSVKYQNTAQGNQYKTFLGNKFNRCKRDWSFGGFFCKCNNTAGCKQILYKRPLSVSLSISISINY